MAEWRVVTLVFTDLEGSTRLVQRLGPAWGEVLVRYRELVREQVARCAGHEVDNAGDGFFLWFDDVRGAADCAEAVHQALAAEAWPAAAVLRVRTGVHTGRVEIRDGHL